MKHAGVQAVIAKSFARIFFRNAINQGLPVIECSEAVDSLEAGEEISIDFSRAVIESAKGAYDFVPLPYYILQILVAGGLIAFIKDRLKREKRQGDGDA